MKFIITTHSLDNNGNKKQYLSSIYKSMSGRHILGNCLTTFDVYCPQVSEMLAQHGLQQNDTGYKHSSNHVIISMHCVGKGRTDSDRQPTPIPGYCHRLFPGKTLQIPLGCLLVTLHIDSAMVVIEKSRLSFTMTTNLNIQHIETLFHYKQRA